MPLPTTNQFKDRFPETRYAQLGVEDAVLTLLLAIAWDDLSAFEPTISDDVITGATLTRRALSTCLRVAHEIEVINDPGNETQAVDGASITAGAGSQPRHENDYDAEYQTTGFGRAHLQTIGPSRRKSGLPRWAA